MGVEADLELAEPNLRQRLIVADVAGLALAWVPVLAIKYAQGMSLWKITIVEFAMIAVGMVLLVGQGLYLARVASSRVEEIRRVIRSSVFLGIAQTALLMAMGVQVNLRLLVVGPLLSVVLLLWFRGGYRAWLNARRAAGRHLRDVVIVGANADAASLIDMLMEHPEAGFRVRGVVGPSLSAAINGLSPRHLGELDELFDVLDRERIDGVILIVGSMPSTELTELIGRLEAADVRIQVSTGLHGLAQHRLRVTPVAFQSLYYLESGEPSSPQLLVKRWIDLLIALPLLVVLSPVLLVVAALVKLDGGPVLFRQERVGRNGERFFMLKFRSMVVDAEARLAALQADNERRGPLFKLERDPRVTRVGHILRATSLDELPQLINVLRGEMSIIGPRPALPSEVAEFDDRLLDRLQMPPGITGLWQVEARDNPHFGAYRRLDLFYVNNWTPTLDIVILVATVEQVLAKAWRTLLRREKPTRLAMAPVEDDGTQIRPV
jgi:exopolysaccharide biosynthesis polyprenyl glycosylphosphotransferase